MVKEVEVTPPVCQYLMVLGKNGTHTDDDPRCFVEYAWDHVAGIPWSVGLFRSLAGRPARAETGVVLPSTHAHARARAQPASLLEKP